MSEVKANPPFDSFTFTLVQAGRGRSLFRMRRTEENLYELQVEQGVGNPPAVRFTREMNQEAAQRFKDELDAAGVFGWEEEYADTAIDHGMKWSLSVVFKEGVFSMRSRGGSLTPPHFDDLLESMYKLDLPRPEAASQSAQQGMPDMSALFGGAGAPQGLDPEALRQMQDMLSEAQANPQAFKEDMQREFRSLPAEQQNQLLDMLGNFGMASRSWWENFLRGGM